MSSTPSDFAMMHFEDTCLAIPSGKTLKVSNAYVDQLFGGDIEAMHTHLRKLSAMGVAGLEVDAKGDHLYITHVPNTPKH